MHQVFYSTIVPLSFDDPRIGRDVLSFADGGENVLCSVFPEWTRRLGLAYSLRLRQSLPAPPEARRDHVM